VSLPYFPFNKPAEHLHDWACPYIYRHTFIYNMYIDIGLSSMRKHLHDCGLLLVKEAKSSTSSPITWSAFCRAREEGVPRFSSNAATFIQACHEGWSLSPGAVVHGGSGHKSKQTLWSSSFGNENPISNKVDPTYMLTFPPLHVPGGFWTYILGWDPCIPKSSRSLVDIIRFLLDIDLRVYIVSKSL
jgi:hypothetical protein